jgi:TP901 family phage tail tape measure protein|nr:MAG TPA: minor tail protein [Caudoviricetes sp.]
MAMDADVRLLIGVARGGADGDSEALIRKELNEIMGKIKLEAKLDSKSFGEQIRKQLDAISKNGKFYVNLSKINIGAGAIADFRRQLNTVINTLNLDKGTSITLTAEGIGEVKSKIKETATVTDEAARKMAEFNVQIAAMKKQSKNIDTGLGSLSKGATAEEAAQVTALLERYKAWQVEFETLRLQGVDGSNERRKALEDEAAAILVNIQRINEEREATAEAAQAKVQAEREAKAADDATVTAENRKNAAMKQGVMLLTQMQKAEQDWTAAQSGRSSEHYNNIRQGTVYLQEYLGQLERGEISVDEFQRRLAGLRTSFAESSNAIKSAGENTKTLSERVGGLAAKFTSWLTVSQIVMKLYSSLKKMVSAVIDIDTAMTELKKVTDETSTVYAKYLDDASVRAKKLGATIADTVTASADFARLGYTLDEAAQLADAALVYKNVGDGIEDVSQASESIISTMKAFGIEAENAISIVDKFNEVGNNFAISSEGVGEALRRSASALAAGNNTLDESIALITAANSVVQDADVVGTTMKTVSMYLRAAKTEAEEAGESTEGMANSVSELREELLALTNGKVDIQIDENTFKSTYQIMKELADVWGELTDITQANILEQIGGKRNANVVSSMLENFNVAEDVVKTAANSAGSALKENEKYLDSINGKIAEFKATFEELSMTLIDSDFVKQVIEFGTGLLDVLNVLAKVIDKVGGLNTVLYVTVGILATIKADAIKTFLVTTIPSALAKVTSAVSTFVMGVFL